MQNPDYALFKTAPSSAASVRQSFAPGRFDASSFDFVNALDYKGVKSENGRDRANTMKYETVDNQQGWGPSHLIRAWIDSKTHLPVAYDNGTGMGVFSFSPGTPGPGHQDAPGL